MKLDMFTHAGAHDYLLSGKQVSKGAHTPTHKHLSVSVVDVNSVFVFNI